MINSEFYFSVNSSNIGKVINTKIKKEENNRQLSKTHGGYHFQRLSASEEKRYADTLYNIVKRTSHRDEDSYIIKTQNGYTAVPAEKVAASNPPSELCRIEESIGTSEESGLPPNPSNPREIRQKTEKTYFMFKDSVEGEIAISQASSYSSSAANAFFEPPTSPNVE